MTETLTETRLMAEVKQGEYGLWFIRLSGNGYPTDEAATPERLLELRADGYVLSGDVELYVALYGPAELREPWDSQAAMDADSAGYGGVAFHGALADASALSFDDAFTFGEIEVAYFNSIEEAL